MHESEDAIPLTEATADAIQGDDDKRRKTEAAICRQQ